jgi:NADPH-dependent glutamate synthase beta subunit-like oxidoreductase
VSAVGQAVDFTGLEEFDNGKGTVSADKNYQVAGKAGTFAGGDVLRPHLLTTAIGQAAADIDRSSRRGPGSAAGSCPRVDTSAR